MPYDDEHRIEVREDYEAEAKYWMEALKNPHLKHQNKVPALISQLIEQKLTNLLHPTTISIPKDRPLIREDDIDRRDDD